MDLNYRGPSCRTPLYDTAYHGHLYACRLLFAFWTFFLLLVIIRKEVLTTTSLVSVAKDMEGVLQEDQKE